jgi:hypothetical protein
VTATEAEQLRLDAWQEAQRVESAWWNSCVHTYAEETRQIDEARMMGLQPLITERPYRYPVIDMAGRSVVDVGAGPVSLLLKAVNLGPFSAVVEPCGYPDWVWQRYDAHKLVILRIPGERLDIAWDGRVFDEAWIMNVLQHVYDPEQVVMAARAVARQVRVFEWVNVPPYPGHPNMLDAADLDRWLEGKGRVRMWRKYRRYAYAGLFAGCPAR